MSSNGTVRAAGRVELMRLDGDAPRTTEVRGAVLRLRLPPGQRRYAGEAVENLPRADADPNRTPFAVLRDGEPVGFGVLDRVGILADIAEDPRRAVQLRAFYLAPEWQGQGVGRAACAALDPLVRAVAPEAREVLLTVKEANPGAIRAYLGGGFTETGRPYLSGEVGPQLVLRRPVG